ncbi:MAG: peptidylprolyl isomerase [Opitutales bacterium]
MSLTINGEAVHPGRIPQRAQRLFEDLKKEMEGRPEGLIRAEAEARARDMVIEEVLLTQDARKQAVPVDEKQVEAEMKRLVDAQGGEEAFRKKLEEAGIGEETIREDIRDSLRFTAHLRALTEDVADPDEAAVEAFYQKHSKAFATPDKVRAAHIVKHAPADNAVARDAARRGAEDAHRRITGGEAFSAVARVTSDCPSKEGDLGWFPRGQMVEAFDDVVFNLEPEAVSAPFETEFGWHVATVLEKADGGTQPLDEVRDQIREHLTGRARDQVIRDRIAALKAAATIEETKG